MHNLIKGTAHSQYIARVRILEMVWLSTLTLPRSGTEREVGGMISARSRKKTVRERRMEMERETFSPESEGR